CGADSDLIAATPEQRPGLAKAAALFTEEDLTRYFQILLQTDYEVRREMDPRVHLEMGLLRLVNASRLAPLEELLAEMGNGGTGGRAGGGSGPRNASSGAATSQGASRSATASAAVMIAPKLNTTNNGSVRSVERTASEGGPYTSTAPAAGALGANGSASAAAPARKPLENIAASNESAKKEVATTGISVEQVAEIKAAIQGQQKFIAELLEHASRWELEGSELRIYFPSEESAYAGLIEGRETLEKIRASSSKVLGRAV